MTLTVLLISGFNPMSFAESNRTILMPSGSSDPDAPFFWSEQTTGVTTGEITIYPDDSVTWKNADTAMHTITSVTQAGEIDGKFDSGLINQGESFSLTFTEINNFYYFCSIHPWMNGVVHVVKNPGSVQSLHNVGSGYSDDGLGFEVKYILDASLLNDVRIDHSEKTLTFLIDGNTESDQISLVLPAGLIENPSTVWVDDKITEFETESIMTGTKLLIPLESNSKEITIMGTYVIPEFGSLIMIILVIGFLPFFLLARSKFFLTG